MNVQRTMVHNTRLCVCRAYMHEHVKRLYVIDYLHACVYVRRAYGISTLRLGGGVDNYVLALMLCIGDCVVAFARVCACVCLFVSVGVI